MFKFSRIIVLYIPCIFLTFGFSQSSEELKKFMETYDKIKVDQEANEIVKKGIDSDVSVIFEIDPDFPIYHS